MDGYVYENRLGGVSYSIQVDSDTELLLYEEEVDELIALLEELRGANIDGN